MGGSSRFQFHKKASSTAPASSSSSSSSSLFSFFKPPTRRPSTQCRDNSRAVDDAMNQQKSWRSDYDKRPFVGKPGIDRDASKLIEDFHKRWVSESELPKIAV